MPLPTHLIASQWLYLPRLEHRPVLNNNYTFQDLIKDLFLTMTVPSKTWSKTCSSQWLYLPRLHHRSVLYNDRERFYVSQGRCVIGPLCHRHTVWSVCHRAVLSQWFYVSQRRCVIGPLCHRHTVWSVCQGPFCHSAQSLFYRTFVTILVNT